MADASSIPLLYGYIQKLQHTGSNIELLKQDASNFLTSAFQLPTATFVIMFILGLLFWCCVGWVSDEIREQISQNDHDPEEFDYLASSEAIPAKFNLAEAYMQMSDFKSAAQVLSEIIAHGNNEQRKQAMSLLDDIKE